jgi:hypothetical protein
MWVCLYLRRRRDLQSPIRWGTRDVGLSLSEASTGFEPVMRVLQTLALPLGHDAGHLLIKLRIAD